MQGAGSRCHPGHVVIFSPFRPSPTSSLGAPVRGKQASLASRMLGSSETHFERGAIGAPGCYVEIAERCLLFKRKWSALLFLTVGLPVRHFLA